MRFIIQSSGQPETSKKPEHDYIALKELWVKFFMVITLILSRLHCAETAEWLFRGFFLVRNPGDFLTIPLAHFYNEKKLRSPHIAHIDT
jgi:hypothetical protein